MQGNVGIFVDAVNVTMNGGFGLRYDILRKFATRDGCVPSRMNVYLAYDQERAEMDESYRQKTERFSEVLRDFEFKVIEKPMQYYEDESTEEVITKSTVDMDMAVDMLTQADHLDKIILLTNNGSYVSVIRAIQEKGTRVELVGFDDMSPELRKEVDLYISGYLIPGLLPIESPYGWGEVGSRVRGVCYDFSHNDGYGFLRYLVKLNENLWITDSRFEESPYQTVFAHISQFENNLDTEFLPSRHLIFEFDLIENEKGLVAEEIVLVSAP
ncbi:NYN domain-containing protein [Fodinibius salsisoli]|uniref:NYN domain-containing protein n=1 Tax=Fodinibius salsisoli TaxID=2820877 RepID=A0ABT3PNZ0_9BACT|nr:NYN domain-containing protein [Fodinibius salsisoli]MCW9707569.1 NYN domain-containing protein [Fodinibius salsisoli]